MEIAVTDKKTIFNKKPKLSYIGCYAHRPGVMRAFHSHAFCEVMLVKEGKGTYYTEACSYPVEKGNLVVVNPEVNHSEFMNGDETEFIFLGIDKVDIDGLKPGNLLSGSDVKILNTGVYFEQIREYFDHLVVENELKDPYYSIINEALLSVIIAFILRLSAERADDATENKKTFGEVKEFLDRNFTAIDTVDSVCKSLYINKYYLTHLFTDTLGVPPLQYIIQKRMTLAKTMLSSSDKTIGEIAKACGYDDAAYFCRVFKRTENLTPLAYRKQFRK